MLLLALPGLALPRRVVVRYMEVWSAGVAG